MEISELKAKKYFVAIIDGSKLKNVKSFLKEIGKVFSFPSYYGENLDAFGECINDLDWLEEKNYALIIENSSQFLGDESIEVRNDILNFLESIKKQWANVPNFNGEENFRNKADFKVIMM